MEFVIWPTRRIYLCKSCGRAADPLWMNGKLQIFFEYFPIKTRQVLREGADSYAVSLA